MRQRNRAAKSASPSQRETSNYLFVYGTLMRGRKRHSHLARNPSVHFVGTGRIQAELFQLRGRHYPGAVPTAKRNQFVHGELYRIDYPEKTLSILDDVEGRDEGLFRRQLVDVWSNGKKTKAWTYFYARPLTEAEPITSGSYGR
ncbi:MAG: gamma-glutamylcyclotransferase [Terriglobia bacterium]